MNDSTFLQKAAGLSESSVLRLLIEEVIEPSSILPFFGGLDRLPRSIPDEGLGFGAEQSVEKYRRELAEIQAWPDAEADERLARHHVNRKKYQTEEASRFTERMSVIGPALELVFAWHPQLSDLNAQERAEILRARLITKLVEMRDWATMVNPEMNGIGLPDLPDTGAAYRDAEVKRVLASLTEAGKDVAQLYAEYQSVLPVLLDFRRFLHDAAASTD